MNLEQAIFMVQHCYPDHVIVAVDASVGQTEHVGCITLGKGAPGRGLAYARNCRRWEISLLPALWEDMEIMIR